MTIIERLRPVPYIFTTHIAFLAHPFGMLFFRHFGDKIGRKTTLVASLLVMGISTILIGMLYSWTGMDYSLGGILGASLAPYIAQQLVQHGGLSWVGGYVSVAAAISLLSAFFIRETRDTELA